MKRMPAVFRCVNAAIPSGVAALIFSFASSDKKAAKPKTSDPGESRPTHQSNTKAPQYQLDEFRGLQRKMVGSNMDGIMTLDMRIRGEFRKLPIASLTELLWSLDPLNNKEDGGLASKIMDVLAERDPAAALCAAERLTFKDPAVNSSFIYSSMVKANPAAVSEWIAKNGVKSGDNLQLAVRCASELARNAPDDAAALIIHCDDKTRKYLVGNIVGELAKNDPQGALQIARQFPPYQRTDAYICALTGAGMTDAGQAFKLLSKIDDPAVAAGAYQGIFLCWKQQEPKPLGR